MKKANLFFFFVLVGANIMSFCQTGIINPQVYNKPLPDLITVANQPSNFKFTSHIVNIKIPQNEIDNWNVNLEQQYIQNVFNLIPDKNFVISQYSGFYFPASSGLTGAHHVNYKNEVYNIGLDIFDFNYIPTSQKFMGLTRLERNNFLGPKVVSHELFHQWNSFLENAMYWLVDPSFHIGLVEQNTSIFDNYRNDFQPSQNNRFKYKQYISNGFVSPLEGYLAGLWDMPINLRTLKDYYHGADVTMTFDNSCNCYIVDNVQAEGIIDLSQAQLFQMYGGERIPNYLNSNNEYDAVVIVFSAIDFLSDNDLKIFHYGSVLEEMEGMAAEYNIKYDEIYILASGNNDPDYGFRHLNPHHASYKNLHFFTNIFNSPLEVENIHPLREDFLIYPNPAKTSFFIEGQSEIEKVLIFNCFGKLIKTYSSQPSYEISEFSSGIYYVKIGTKNGFSIKKLIVE